MTQLEEHLRFLAGGGDSRQDNRCVARVPVHDGVSASANPAAGADPRSTLTSVDNLAGVFEGLRMRQFFQLDVASLQHLNHARIETLASFIHYVGHGLVQWQRPAVLSIGSQRIQAINRRQNSCSDGYVFALQSVRVTAAIPFLVMRPDDRHDRIRKFHLFENLRPNNRMNLHLLEFFRSKFAGLGNDVFGNGEFADVMQNRRSLQSLGIVLAETKIFRNFHSVDANPLQVIVSGVILGLNCQRQGFDGSQVKVGYLLGMPCFILELTQIKPIRPVHEVYRRQNQQRRLPSDMTIQES